MQEDASASSLSFMLNGLIEKMGKSSDFIVRDFRDAATGAARTAVCYLDGLADKHQLNILLDTLTAATGGTATHAEIEAALRERIRVGGVRRVDSTDAVLAAILTGEAAILVDRLCGAVIVSVQGAPHRPIEEPSTQTVVRGPKE